MLVLKEIYCCPCSLLGSFRYSMEDSRLGVSYDSRGERVSPFFGSFLLSFWNALFWSFPTTGIVPSPLAFDCVSVLFP